MDQVVRNRVRSFRVAPALGKTLALALGGNRQEELLNATIRLAANAVMVAGLLRIGEAAQRIIDGQANRAVAHATSGPALQHNLVAVLEGE